MAISCISISLLLLGPLEELPGVPEQAGPDERHALQHAGRRPSVSV